LKKFINKIDNFEEHIVENSGCVDRDSSNVFDNSDESIDTFVTLIRNILDCVHSVKTPVGGIMVEMQNQDIIQQQLIHIMEAMEDILVVVENYDAQKGENSDEVRNILTLLHFLMNTVEKQLDRLINEIEVMIGGIKSKFDVMAGCVEKINSDKQAILSIAMSNGSMEGNPVTDLLFQAPKKLISDIRNGYFSGLQQKKDITKLFGEIMRDIRKEVKIVNTFLPKAAAIDNLMVLAKIEQARYKLDLSGGQGNSTVDFIQLKSFSQLEGIVEDVSHSFKMVEKHYKRSVKVIKDEEANFNSIEIDINKSSEIILATEETFLKKYEEIMTITGDLFHYIDSNIEIFEEVEMSVDSLKQKFSGLSNIKSSVESMVDEFGGAISIGDCSFKDIIIQKIVDKCTVDTERAVFSQEYEDFEIEETTGSSITLF